MAWLIVRGMVCGLLSLSAVVQTTVAQETDATPTAAPGAQGNPGKPSLSVGVPKEAEFPEIQAAIEAFKKGDGAGALAQLDEAVKAHPELPPSRLMLARLLLNTGQIAPGRALLEEAATRHRDRPEIYNLFGNLALLENRFTDAELEFEHAQTLLKAPPTAIAPIPPAVIAEAKIHAVSGRAAVAERRRSWPEALTLLEDLKALQPDDAATFQRIGRALFATNRMEEARKALEEASRLNPSLDPPAVTIGWLHLEANQPMEAEASLASAIAANPKSLAAQAAMAGFLLRRERLEDAKPFVKAAAAIDADASLVRRLQAQIARLENDPATSERYLRPVVAANPNDLASADGLVIALANQQDEAKREEAVKLAQETLRKSPNRVDGLIALGYAYQRVGRLDEALQAMRAATASGQVSADVAYYLGSLQASRGETAEAIRLLRAALSAPVGQFTMRAAAKRKLEALEAIGSQP